MRRLVNLTGHPLSLHDPHDSGTFVVLEPEGRCRISSTFDIVEHIAIPSDRPFKLPVVTVAERIIRNLPAPEDGTLYIVSGLAAALAKRPDVVSPAHLLRESRVSSVRGARALLLP